MDQVSKTMKREMTLALVGVTSTFVVAFWSLWRRQARPSWWPAALRLVHSSSKTMVMAVENEDDEDRELGYDCIVCLCQVSPRDDYRKLPNCNHGVQFHANCIDAWLKDHSTCPICRSHIPRLLSQRLQTYISEHLLEDVISYCNSALDSVANSIGDCRNF